MYIEFEDNRTTFRSISFSNFKKTQVIKKLEDSLFYQNLNDALFCTGELLCSGFILEIWNLYIQYICKYIHIDNPKLSIFINNKFNDFKNIARDSSCDLELRESKEVWVLLFSITMVLCECNKSSVLNNMKFKFDFNTGELFSNLKAPDVSYIQPYFKQGDPKEMFIPLNELIYHLKVTKNNKEIYYWIDWIIEYDIEMTKRKKPIHCIDREFIKTKLNSKPTKKCIQESKENNIIWMLWEILLSYNENEILKRIIYSYFELFSIKYNQHSNKKKDYIIYVCIMFLTNNKIDYTKKIIENNEIFHTLDENIEKVYLQIKKNERVIIE
jgi:hypothetical protein